LLLNHGLKSHEAKAAADASERFKAFGLKVETITDPEAKVWKDRCRQQLFDVVFGDLPLALPYFYRPVYTVPNDGALILGLTARGMVSDGGKSIEGFNLYGVGAVVTVDGLRKMSGSPYRNPGPADSFEQAAAITLGLMGELGHALVGKPSPKPFGQPGAADRYDGDGRCLTGGCILANTDRYLTHLRSLAGARADFCANCTDLIKGMVTQVNYLGCA
jgi:hypothetical protein